MFLLYVQQNFFAITFILPSQLKYMIDTMIDGIIFQIGQLI